MKRWLIASFVLTILLVYLGIVNNSRKFVSACFILPKSNGECMFSVENTFGFDKNRVSRLETGINFGKGGNDWRLSGFNDLKFDIYNEGNGGKNWNILGSMRVERKYPFKAIFTINKENLERISKIFGIDKLNFRIVSNGQISEVEAYPDKDFVINYQNYECVGGKGDCLEDVSRVKSISHDEANLIVNVKNGAGEYVPLESVFSRSWNVLYIGVILFLALLLLVIIKNGPLLGGLISKYQLIDFGYFIFYSLSIFVFIKLFAKIYLRYYPHSFVAEYLPFIKYALLLIVFLFSFEYLWNKILSLYKVLGNKFLLAIFGIVMVLLFVVSYVNGFSFSPRAIYYEAGFDQLTYYSWARDILRDKTFFVEPTVVFSKPFFLYFKALEMLIFGDANNILDTCSHWVLLSLPIMLIFVSLLGFGDVKVKTRKDRLLKLILVEVILMIGVYWYFMMNGWFVRFIENISEMPAWFFMGVATCLVSLLNIQKNKKLLVITIFVVLSLFMRTTNLIYIPILVSGVLISLGNDITWINIKKILIFMVGILIGGAIIFIHSKITSISGDNVGKYITDNTTIFDLSLGTLLSRWPRLLPNLYEVITWSIFIFSLFINLIIRRKWWKFLLGIVVVLVTLLAHLPMLSDIMNNSFGNRGLFWIYWMLSYLSVVLILDTVKPNKVVSGNR